MSRGRQAAWRGAGGVLLWGQRGGEALIWHLYVVRTVDRNLYAGVSTDVARRFAEHASQGRKAAKYLRAHRPARLVFSQAIGTRSLALKVEYRFKQLAKPQKERIVRAGRLYFDEVSGRIAVPVRRPAIVPRQRI